jgi:predicted nucleic acid-binding protein
LTLWFLDASVLLASEDPDDAQHQAARHMLGGDDPLVTLDLAYYEVANVALRSWRDPPAARRLGQRVDAVAGEGGLVRAGAPLLDLAVTIADDQGISVYDASYVAGAQIVAGQLVSCDIRDLVPRGLELLPEAAADVNG